MWTGVTGLLSKTSDGWKRFKTVILTLCSSCISTTTDRHERNILLKFFCADLNPIYSGDVPRKSPFFVKTMKARVFIYSVSSNNYIERNSTDRRKRQASKFYPRYAKYIQKTKNQSLQLVCELRLRHN